MRWFGFYLSGSSLLIDVLRYLPIDDIATLPWNSTVRFNEHQNGQINHTARFGAFPIFNRIKMLETIARICLLNFGARMSTGTHGTIVTVQTNLQRYEVI